MQIRGSIGKRRRGVKNVARIISNSADKQLLVVISAMGKTTDALERLTRAYFEGLDSVQEIFEDIKGYHYQILEELFPDKAHPAFDDISNTFVEIDWILEDEPFDFDYIYDQIVSIGELVSTRIVSHYLGYIGVNNQWVDARNYIQTDNTYREGKVDWNKTRHLAEAQLLPLLQQKVLITQGFIGSTSENFTTTLGREGSDYSAAIFASCLKANGVTIWKDVPGVLNADPKWFDHTELIQQLSYHDAIELAYYGATVIHPKTIKPLQNNNIPLYVRSFLTPDAEGTVIGHIDKPLPVPSFIFKVNQVLISILPKDYSFIIEENLSQIFDILHKYKVKVNTMLNSALSFSISVDHDEEKITKLIAALSVTYRVKYNKGMELVTIRYYNQQTIDRVTANKKVLLEVKSRHTCQMVMKDNIEAFE
ncbi:aspartate kinase [Arcticibacter sp. MXS-1]|uniref:aspartate kinase n=1 Tax=Arcticibacter sp. MXS-1 TaxID=3341726 RepID=UPI0035A93D41